MGKTGRPDRYDLNQIPYEYAAEVMDRCKGLGLVERVPEGLWMEVCNVVQEAANKAIPKKKESKKANCFSETPLFMGSSRQEYWSGLPLPSPEDCPDPGIEPRSPALQADS